MIWNATQPAATAETLEPPVREALSRGLDAALSHDAPIEEIVHSVAAWLHDHRRASATRPPAREELSLLTAQALQAVGHPLCARRMALVGSGLVRSSVWAFAAGGTVWTLDLAPLASKPADRYELPFLVLLRTTLRHLASIWPNNGAPLVLGLRHLRVTVEMLLGPRATRRETDRLARDIRIFIAQAAAADGARPVTCVVLDPVHTGRHSKAKDAKHDRLQATA